MGAEKILEILVENGVKRGVVIESQGMKKVLGYNLSPEKIFGIFSDRRPFNRTIMAIIEKENIYKMITLINNFWRYNKDMKRNENRVIFSIPINNLTIGV